MTQVFDLSDATQYIETLFQAKDDEIDDLKDGVGRLEMELSDAYDEMRNEIG